MRGWCKKRDERFVFSIRMLLLCCSEIRGGVNLHEIIVKNKNK